MDKPYILLSITFVLFPLWFIGWCWYRHTLLRTRRSGSQASKPKQRSINTAEEGGVVAGVGTEDGEVVSFGGGGGGGGAERSDVPDWFQEQQEQRRVGENRRMPLLHPDRISFR